MYDHNLMEPDLLADWFRALSDPNRLRILELLVKGPRCGCEIQAALGLTQSNVSRHLTCLRNAGLIADQRRGRRVYCRLSAPGRVAARFIASLRTAWRERGRAAGATPAAARAGRTALVRKRPS